MGPGQPNIGQLIASGQMDLVRTMQGMQEVAAAAAGGAAGRSAAGGGGMGMGPSAASAAAAAQAAAAQAAAATQAGFVGQAAATKKRPASAMGRGRGLHSDKSRCVTCCVFLGNAQSTGI
jgi:hypothetical protein